jgi:Methyltransferase domain
MNATEEIKTPSSLGFGMEGMGARVLGLVDEMAARFDKVTYVEIGVGEGITLAAIAYRLRAKASAWRAVGIELPHGYSFNQLATEENARKEELELSIVHPSAGRHVPPWQQITVYLKDAHEFLPENFAPQGPVHMALIDGCHGKACVTLDFLLLEPLIAKGGFVMFHDFGQDQVGQPQPHCPIVDVRGACYDLGLLTNARAGWQFLCEIIGDKQHGSGDMGVFEKI